MIDDVSKVCIGEECSSSSDEPTLRAALDRLKEKLPVAVREDDSSASQEGFEAAIRGDDIGDNPYGDGSLYKQITWICGWRRGAFHALHEELANPDRLPEKMNALSARAHL